MDTIRCSKCGVNNTLVIPSDQGQQPRVNLNCGTCGEVLLTIHTPVKTKTALNLGANWRKWLVMPVAIMIISFLALTGASFWSSKETPTTDKPVNYARSAFYSYSVDQRKLIQLSLKTYYNYRGAIDGLWGPGTQTAYNRLRKAEPQNVKGLSHSEVYANMINNISRQSGNVYGNSNNAIGNFFMNQLIGQSPLFRQAKPPPVTTNCNVLGNFVNCTTSQ